MSKSIYCKRLPKELIDDNGHTAQLYFKEFGRIREIRYPAIGSCVVEYESIDEARRALHESGFYKGKTFIVQPGNLYEREKSRADPSVQAELDIMSGKQHTRAPQLPLKTPTTHQMAPPRPQLSLFKKPPQSSQDGTMLAQSASMPAQPPSPVMIHKMTVPELQKLIATPAFSSEQKFRVLDARDKLNRLHLAQTRDLKQAKATKGSCPDMCPEKERLMREAKHQIASFETVPGSRTQIDHQLAVKQYSRSSADQEMPLPRELRAEPVLRMTMTYLLHEIADLCDTSQVGVSDWFHFLWDRTRSIRKDIAQQELCCQGSVHLVEQCARFHIHCAGRLIAEEPQVFDQKINTENLTKCLQSLKYMYHDLRLKGEQCPNEPEFRAYIILLNLQDSNFLWEVKQLPVVRIQQSPEVRFAVDVFKALEQNNYIRFFKLVRRTTYMNACILLRYFSQVRARALATIVKAYTIKSGVALSLANLAYALAFEDVQAAAQFFEYYGLQCDNERVLVDRSTFYYPDLPFLMERAINIVEQKRCVSVGAAIAGGEEHLAAKSLYQNHVPETSFDSRGFLKARDDVNISVEESDDVDLTGGEEEEEEQEDDQRDVDQDYEEMEEDADYAEELEGGDDDQDYDDNDQEDEEEEYSDNYEAEEQEDEDGEIDDDTVDSESLFKKPSTQPGSIFRSGGLKSPATTPLSSRTTPNTFKFQSEGNHLDKLPKLPTSGFSFSAMAPPPKSPQKCFTQSVFGLPAPAASSFGGFSFTKEILRSSAQQSPKTHSPEKMKKTDEDRESMAEVDLEADLLQKRADALLLAESQSENLIQDVCAEEIQRTAELVLKQYQKRMDCSRRCAESIITDTMREILGEMYREECMAYHVGIYARQKQLKRVFGHWRRVFVAQRIAREKTQMAPMWMPTMAANEHNIELGSGHQQGTLNDLVRYRQGEARGVSWESPVADKLDVTELISVGLSQRFPQHQLLLVHYLISIPSEAEEGLFGCSSYLRKWHREHLTGVESLHSRPKEPLICRRAVVNNNAFQTTAICARVVIGEELRQEEDRTKCLVGTEENLDGVVFYLSEKEGSGSGRRRLRAILDTYKRQGVPVTVLNMDAFRDEEEIMLSLGMMTDDRVGSVLVDPRTEKRTLRDSLREGVTFLVENFALPHDHLRAMQLVNLVTSAAGDTLWMRLAINARVNAATAETLRHGRMVAEIYNEAVDRVAEMCTGEDYSAFVDVPRVFEEHGLIKRSQLVAGGEASSYCCFPKEWRCKRRRQLLKAFLMSLKLSAGLPQVQIVNGGFSPVEGVQSFVREVFGPGVDAEVLRNTVYAMAKSVSDNPEVAWIQPLKILTQKLFLERLRTASDDLPQVVVYDGAAFQRYQDTPWWLQSTVLKRKIEVDEEGESVKKRRVTPEPLRLLERGTGGALDDILRKAEKCVARAEKIVGNFRQNRDALDTICSKYDDRLSRVMMLQQNQEEYSKIQGEWKKNAESPL